MQPFVNLKQTQGSGLARAATALGLIALVGCHQRVAVVSMPMIPVEHAGSEDATQQPLEAAGDAREALEPQGPTEGDRARYWSAFAYIDEFSLLRHWGRRDMDHAFITARVKLPTRGGVITRDFPLYTLKGGSVQSHQGVDLLQKFPLSEASREQVTISLEVRYLADAEALETVRVVIANAERLAEPYLRNFPVASSIMTSAVALSDQLAPRENDDINTAAFSINPRKLEGLHAYLLVTEALDSIPKGLSACLDKPSALCKGSGNYAARAYHDNVYVTLRFEHRDDVYDPLMLLRGSGSCPLIDRRTLDASREYLRSNISLFVDHDIAIAEAAYAYAEQYLRLREGAAQRNFGGMLDILNEYGNDDRIVRELLQASDAELEVVAPTQPERMLVTVLRCYQSFWNQTPGHDVLAAWKLLTTTSDAKSAEPTVHRLNVLGTALSRLSAFSGGSDWQGDGKNTGTVIELLRNEAKALIASQERAIDKALVENPDCGQADVRRRLLGLFSTECRQCALELEKHCIASASTREKDELKKVVASEIATKRDVDAAASMAEIKSLTSNPTATEGDPKPTEPPLVPRSSQPSAPRTSL